MEDRAREVVRIGDKAFEDKKTVDALWQEIALNFYPERADFTTKRNDGQEFADHLFSSYPVMARRELGNMMAEFIRPDKFFEVHVDDEDLDEADDARAYLEHVTDVMWRAMSDPIAQLVRAEGQTDQDFVTFGNGVLHFGPNSNRDALLFRNYHLRDNAWAENADGTIDCNHRNWKPTAAQLYRLFPKTVSADVKKACGHDGGNGKDPFKTFECRHVVLPSRLYDYKGKGGKKFPFVSLYVECESETVLEEVGLSHFPYVISRWQTVAGSPYGISMVTSVLLPDGRTIQVVMRTLREAGELHVNPPMISTQDVVRGDIGLYPGGITIIDREYDERSGEALRPLARDKSGFPIGEAIAEALKQDIRQGFLLDKIQLPETASAKGMTATEVRRRMQEHIRGTAPIVKPVQRERNQPLCDGVFQVLAENGVFPREEIPDSLASQELKFKFRSPLDNLIEESEAQGFVAGLAEVLGPAASIKPELLEMADLETGVRDSLRAYGWKQKWFKPKEAIEAAREEVARKQQLAEVMQAVTAGADIAKSGGAGAKSIVDAEMASRGDPNALPRRALPAPQRRAY